MNKSDNISETNEELAEERAPEASVAPEGAAVAEGTPAGAAAAAPDGAVAMDYGENILEVRRLKKYFPAEKNFWGKPVSLL